MPLLHPTNPVVFLDISIGDRPSGTLFIELFEHKLPRTCKNFRMLCTGEVGRGRKCNLHFLNCNFHRVIKSFMAQGGDIESGDGNGGESIYGPCFDDESFEFKHSGRGYLSMANSGPATNSSQFFILFAAAPHLNGKHCVFGRVLTSSECREQGAHGDPFAVLAQMEAIKTDRMDRPKQPIIITGCGLHTRPELPESGSGQRAGVSESTPETAAPLKQSAEMHASVIEEEPPSSRLNESELSESSASRFRRLQQLRAKTQTDRRQNGQSMRHELAATQG